MSTVTSEFLIQRVGAQKVVWLSYIDDKHLAQKDEFGFGAGSAKMSLDHRVYILFLLLTHLIRYVVNGNKAYG